MVYVKDADGTLALADAIARCPTWWEGEGGDEICSLPRVTKNHRDLIAAALRATQAAHGLILCTECPPVAAGELADRCLPCPRRRAFDAADVVALVVAGRNIAYVDPVDADLRTALDGALEKFAASVGWEDEPDRDRKGKTP